MCFFFSKEKAGPEAEIENCYIHHETVFFFGNLDFPFQTCWFEMALLNQRFKTGFFFEKKKGGPDAGIELILLKFFPGFFCLFNDILYNKNCYLAMVRHPSCKHSAIANLLKSYMLARPCFPKTILFKNLNYPTLWQRAKFSHAKHLPAPLQEY